MASMSRGIDDEAKSADLVLVAWHKEAALFRVDGTHATNRGDNFGHAGVVI